MKSTLCLALALSLSACGSSKNDSEASNQPAYTEAPLSSVNPFQGRFKSPCKYANIVTVENTDLSSKVKIEVYHDLDCKDLGRVDEYERTYKLASGKKLGGIYDVDITKDQETRYGAWREVDEGMVMEAEYWYRSSTFGQTPEARDYTLYDVILVRQK